MYNYCQYFITLLTGLLPFTLFAQDSPVLEGYIQEGLKNNLALKQKRLSYQQNLKDLATARGAFFPDISFNARYSVADGGRTIEFPVGDLLNPVHSTLNQLTRTLPPSQQFPERQVENQEFQFYRPTEHETKVELVQPVFYPKIYFNHQIKQEQAILGKIDEQSYRRQLIAEIKTAYFNYLKTLQLEEILNQSKTLLQENKRVSHSLFENEKVTVDHLYKAEAELQKMEQEIAAAQKNKYSTKGYFNFLLNKPLDAAIVVDSMFTVQNIPASLDTARQMAVKNSRDLQALEVALNITEKNLNLQKSSLLPTISAVIDYGFQGENYSFTREDDFVLASVVLKWEIFKGKQNRSAIEKARIQQDIQQTRYEEAKKGIELQVINLFYDIEAIKRRIHALDKEKLANEQVLKVIQKKYNQGRANILAFTDARTAYVNSSQQLIIARYDYYILMTEMERMLGMLNESIYYNDN